MAAPGRKLKSVPSPEPEPPGPDQPQKPLRVGEGQFDLCQWIIAAKPLHRRGQKEGRVVFGDAKAQKARRIGAAQGGQRLVRQAQETAGVVQKLFAR